MSLPDDLLVQARLLLAVDRTRPRQANLRRAVSSAYYALFHLLVGESARRVVPASSVSLAIRIGRAVTHAEIRNVCHSLIRRNVDGVLLELLGQPPSTRLLALCLTFVELLDARHAADYDLAESLNRTDAEEYIKLAEVAFSSWREMRNTEEATVFLAALLFAKRWSR